MVTLIIVNENFTYARSFQSQQLAEFFRDLIADRIAERVVRQGSTNGLEYLVIRIVPGVVL